MSSKNNNDEITSVVQKSNAPADQSNQNAKKLTRRELFVGVGSVAVLLALGGTAYAAPSAVVRPPGGQDEKSLLSLCVHCQKCFEVCPEHVIKPMRIEDGIAGMRTPVLDFANNWCNWCQEDSGYPQCVASCPTGALSLPATADVHSVVLGKAEINTEWCLAYRMAGCKTCYDACPYEAIELDDLGRPFVVANACNGCGACECECVSLKEGSISEGATARAITVAPLQEAAKGDRQ